MHSRPTVQFLLALGCVLGNIQSTNADFYVASDAEESGSGGKDDPFQTLAEAQEAVREELANQSEDIRVHVASGNYLLNEPLNLTSEDSGNNGFRVIWQADGNSTYLMGGSKITDWVEYDSGAGIYQAEVPAESESRHLFVDDKHAQRARSEIHRDWVTDSMAGGFAIVSSEADFLLSLEGIEGGEIRSIGSFTDRIMPVDSIGDDGTIVMEEPAWSNNVMGYDTVFPTSGFGTLYIENVLALLDEDNEYYLDSSNSTLYYKPPSGTDPNDLEIYLPHLEQLLVFSGTYDEPVHDISFIGFNFRHTTWNFPSSSLGYADQQTGAYAGLDKTYDDFEASRPEWWMIPGSVQISAAQNIEISDGSFVALMGGLGVGNDANAHSNGVGLGTQNITISGNHFEQTGTNSVTVGGVLADAHHPSDPRMVNSGITVRDNIFRDTQVTITSGTPILFTYTLDSSIEHNDISFVPYSGLCWGYGWGANDEGGSPEYENRGLYNYQPKYDTPTIMANGYIAGNLIHDYGLQHSDLGGIYTLSKSPNTLLEQNYLFNTDYFGQYDDEGSRDYVSQDSVIYSSGPWNARNERDVLTTGNLTFINIAINQDVPGPSDSYGNTFTDITNDPNLSLDMMRVQYKAGISPAGRGTRSPSLNPEAAYLTITASDGGADVTVANLGSDDITELNWSFDISSGWTVEDDGNLPTSISGDGDVTAHLSVSGSGEGYPTLNVALDYTSVAQAESVEGSLDL
ncbi:hypothetical protein FQN54_005847 [Arachnomyces sp. PD_36]|nr:hypothetical protein FQN54_005847 [Arachnomyces sp. PD_36]